MTPDECRHPDDCKHLLPTKVLAKIVVSVTGCWEYMGNDPSSNGYQRCWHYGTRYQTHRLVYELVTGKDIRKYQLDHLCENVVCCNPRHLDPVTPVVNVRRIRNRRKRPPQC